MRLIFGLLALLLASPAHGAYRAYRLKVTYFPDGPRRPPHVEEVVTTLDPYQWPDYHGEYPQAQVEWLDTWFCPGDTSQRTICPKPKVKSSAPRMPASRADLAP